MLSTTTPISYRSLKNNFDKIPLTGHIVSALVLGESPMRSINGDDVDPILKYVKLKYRREAKEVVNHTRCSRRQSKNFQYPGSRTWVIWTHRCTLVGSEDDVHHSCGSDYFLIYSLYPISVHLREVFLLESCTQARGVRILRSSCPTSWFEISPVHTLINIFAIRFCAQCRGQKKTLLSSDTSNISNDEEIYRSWWTSPINHSSISKNHNDRWSMMCMEKSNCGHTS